MDELNIEYVLRKTLSDRIFVSESDFQFSLAWKIKEEYPDCVVRLEECMWKMDDSIHVDIVVEQNGSIIPIELKYPTKKATIGQVKLKEHAAYDHRCYDVIKDIKRIEDITNFSEYNSKEGYVVVLTNNQSYTKKPKSGKKSLYDNFRIFEGKILRGELSWIGSPSEGTKKGHEESIDLKSSYTVHWNECSTLDTKFWYAVIKIGRIET